MVLFPFVTLILTFLFGIVITDLLAIQIPKWSKLFFAVTLGGVCFSIILFYLALLFSFHISVVIGQLAIGLLVAYYLFKRHTVDLKSYIKSYQTQKFFVLLLICISVIIFLLFYTHVIPVINGDMYTGESSYGDLPWHLSVIARIAYSNTFPIDNPHFLGVPLVYPYLSKFYYAILAYEGWSLRNAMMIPGIIFAISLVGILYDFAYAVTKRTATSLIVMTLFCFNSGIGIYYFLQANAFSLQRILQALASPQTLPEYTHNYAANIQWVNFLSRILVPETSVVFGIPAALILLRLLFFRTTEKLITRFEIFLATILLAFMPLLHTHTFLVLAIILPILTLSTLQRTRWRQQLLTAAVVAGSAVIFAIPIIPLFLHHTTGQNSFIHVTLGWMKTPQEPFWWFWFKNSFLLIPLSLAVFLLPRTHRRMIWLLEGCGLLLFVLLNVFTFQPYIWDNIKFLFWAGLFFDLAAATVLTALLDKRWRLIKAIVVLFIAISISTTFLSLYRAMFVRYVVFSKDAIAAATFMRQQTPPDAVFLTYKVHNGPADLAGRQFLMGYAGQMFTLGIPYAQRDADVTAMYAATPSGIALLKYYHVSYAIVEPTDPEGYPVNRVFFMQFPVVFQNASYTIYKIAS